MSTKITAITSGASHFVGFHDVTPWNTATDELVCLATDVTEDHVPTIGDIASVVVVGEDGSKSSIGETHAWNWQKGARQRFLPALGRRIVGYNTISNSGFSWVMVDLDAPTAGGVRQEISRLPRALYDVSADGRWGLSLDMIKLARCQPGYGHRHPVAGEESKTEEGIWGVDMLSGEVKLILPMAEFLSENFLERDAGTHYFTHIQIAPDSKRFAFIHRCYLESGSILDHLVIADIDGGAARVVQDDKVSHFDWEGADSIVVWCRQNTAARALKDSRLKAIARPLFQLSKRIHSNTLRQNLYNEAFRRIDLSNGRKIKIGHSVLTEDGHPQVNPRHPEIWVNDTYPSPDNVQTLMLFNSLNNTRVDFAALATQPAIKGTTFRCDLHPRWKPSGDMVCVDSAHQGRRQVFVADVSELVAEFVDCQ